MSATRVEDLDAQAARNVQTTVSVNGESIGTPLNPRGGLDRTTLEFAKVPAIHQSAIRLNVVGQDEFAIGISCVKHAPVWAEHEPVGCLYVVCNLPHDAIRAPIEQPVASLRHRPLSGTSRLV
jgi:hypothetical protein